MGIVYEAEDESLGLRVALKVLPGFLSIDPARVRRFEREARAAARLHHTNIVQVFGAGEDGGRHYYVMQLIQGQGLDQVIEELRRLKAGGACAPLAGGNILELTTADIARSLVTGQFVPTTLPPR